MASSHRTSANRSDIRRGWTLGSSHRTISRSSDSTSWAGRHGHVAAPDGPNSPVRIAAAIVLVMAFVRGDDAIGARRP